MRQSSTAHKTGKERKKAISKIISLIVSFIMFFFPMLNVPNVKVDESKFNTEYANIFVHGLSGCGSYDWYYAAMPYWGVFGGDLMQYLNVRGFESYCASVSGTDSATHAVEYLCRREIDDELIDFCIKTGRLYENSTYHNKYKHMLTLRHIGYGIPNVDKTIHNNEYRITIVTYII